MKHLFVSYEIALMAKEKGFDELCITRWGETSKKLYEAWKPMKNSEDGEDFTSAPLYQQLIDWFRVEHNMLIWVETATYLREFNYRYYIETYDNKAEGMKTNNYYKALNDAIKKAFKMIPQISE